MYPLQTINSDEIDFVENATYIGTYHYGPDPGLARWHSWGYEMAGFFIRDMFKVSADKKCLPYQDAGFGIVANRNNINININNESTL